MANPALASAVAEALAAEPLAGGNPPEDETPEGTAEAEAPDGESEGTPPGSAEVGAEVESEGSEEEIPTSLFGVDLSTLPDDAARKEFIHEWREQNKTISKLQREKAELAKAQEETPPAPPPAQEAPEPVDVSSLTDEALAEVLGLDLENSLDPQAAKAALALARGFLDLKGQVDGLTTKTTVAEVQHRWDSQLNDLEQRFGELPVERAELLEWAADNGITDPEAAYWTITGPIRAQVAEALTKKLGDTRRSGKQAASTPRPKSSAPVTGARLESKTVKDAVKEGLEKSMAELGISFGE